MNETKIYGEGHKYTKDAKSYMSMEANDAI